MTIKITHNNIPKPTHVIGYVERLLAGDKLTENELVGLYNYHTLKANAKIKDNFAWLAKACCTHKQDVRPITHFVFVHDGKAYATNGSTMRAAPCDMPDGAYDPKLRLLDTSHPYDVHITNINRVFTPRGVVNSNPGETILIHGIKYTRFDDQFYFFDQTNGANTYEHHKEDGKLYCDFGQGRILLTMALRKDWLLKNGVEA